MLKIVKATKVKSKARVGISGPAGSGKTYSSLSIASGLGDRIVVIDTENGTSAKYANIFDFDIIQLDKFSPSLYVDAIHMAEANFYDVTIIDSLTHAWSGTGGALEMVDVAASRYSGNRFAAWRDVTPEHNKLVDAMVRCKTHLIACMRSKTEYALERDESTGKSVVRKMGMAPIQREGMDYEFDIAGDINTDHIWTITKTRCSDLDNAVIAKPGKDVANIIGAWLSDGIDPVAYAERMFLAKHKCVSWEDALNRININVPRPSSIEEWDTMEILMSGSVSP